MMPISSTPMISALSGGLAMNATRICLWRTTTIRPHRIRNTIIRTRKIRGEETLNGSMSRAMAFDVRAAKIRLIEALPHYGTVGRM